MMRRLGGWDRLGYLAVSMALVLVGCDSPDTEAEFEEFTEATADMRAGDGGILPDAGGGDLASGRYFMAASTVASPERPLFFEVTVTVEEVGGATLADLVFQPLKTDADARGNPRADARTPTGNAITVADAEVVDGVFTADLGEIQINGDANPITGSDIVANLSITGVVQSSTAFCGSVAGQVSQPIVIDLAGSTFGAIMEAGDFTTITDPPFECPEEPGGGDPEPDAGGDS